jgi:hypothetical protein
MTVMIAGRFSRRDWWPHRNGLGGGPISSAIAICAAAMLAYLWFRLPETHRGEPLHGPVFAGSASLVRAPAFLGFALQSGSPWRVHGLHDSFPHYFARRSDQRHGLFIGF